jgi:hypothetical protein
MSNQNILLICGKSATGKSMSLRNLKDPEGVVYLNCEANKALPFPSNFRQNTIIDPIHVYNAFENYEPQASVHTIVIDSLTYLMDMFETQKVLTATNTMKAWGEYAQFFKRLMQTYVASSSKNVIFTAHTADVLNEGDMIMETLVKVKGSLMNQGIESYFTNVLSSKKMQNKKLDNYSSDLLNITEEEDMLGFKYVFQTKLTKDSVNERIRAPLGMWAIPETFIDNDLQLVLDRIHHYYNG